MPATNAAEPVAPGGGQISHAGAVFDPAAPEAAGPESALLELAVPAAAELLLDLLPAERAFPDPAFVVLAAAPDPWLASELPVPDWEVAVVCAPAGVAQITKDSTAIDPATDRIWAGKFAGADRGGEDRKSVV